MQLSLQQGLDPGQHLAIGRALAPLRKQGVLLVGSGMSYHNLAAMFSGGGAEAAVAFDAWLEEAVTDTEARERRLTAWRDAPGGRESHPRAEHLLPLMVAAGAAIGTGRSATSANRLRESRSPDFGSANCFSYTRTARAPIGAC